jgi:DNA-binding LytR/AlgR family response regulator
VSNERYEEIKNALLDRGITVSDSAELVLYEADRYTDNLIVKGQEDSARYVVPASEIIIIESFGHTVEVHTKSGTYRSCDRLYQLANLLDPDKFLRISNSVIIAKDKVKQITPSLSMKFSLTMENGKKVDVTRSYYYIFKEAFGI